MAGRKWTAKKHATTKPTPTKQDAKTAAMLGAFGKIVVGHNELRSATIKDWATFLAKYGKSKDVQRLAAMVVEMPHLMSMVLMQLAHDSKRKSKPAKIDR
jgi:hypothetical protein